MFNFKIIINMSNEFVQAVRRDLFYDEIPELREASLEIVNVLDPFMAELPPTLMIARQVNVDFIEVLDKISAFVKEVETQDVDASYTFKKTLILKMEFHLILTTVKRVGQLVQMMPKMKNEIGD